MTENQKNYRWLAEQFRSKIMNGEWLPSEKISTERALTQKFGVTRVTIRRALRILEDERLIRRSQGSGTYVNPGHSRRIPLMIDYSGSMRDHAAELNRQLISKKIIAASDSIAAKLNIKPGTKILYAERVDSTAEAAVAYDQVYIAEKFAHELSILELEKINFLEAWSQVCHFQVSCCQQYIEAVRADKSCQQHLKLRAGSPVLKSTEFYYTGNHIIAGMFISFYHPEQIYISSNYNWRRVAGNENS